MNKPLRSTLDWSSTQIDRNHRHVAQKSGYAPPLSYSPSHLKCASTCAVTGSILVYQKGYCSS